jgi:hypothetical protein
VSAHGASAYVYARQVGGSGGGGNSGASGGAGASSYLPDVVTGSTTGGILQLRQSARGGNGGGSYSSSGGAGGNATSTLTFDDTVNGTTASTVRGYSLAYGGSGGRANGGAQSGGAGGFASAHVHLTGAHTVRALARAYGGSGGSAIGAGGSGAAGGSALGSDASAIGFNAVAQVVQRGGSGGGGYGSDPGGAGAGSILSNAVSGSTQGGYLRLYQDAYGGIGGYGHGGAGAAGGYAYSKLFFNDNVNPTPASYFNAQAKAVGGNGGGFVSGGTGGAGGLGKAVLALAATHRLNGQAVAIGGNGGTSSTPGVSGNASATATVTATGTGATDTALANAAATAGSGVPTGLALASATAVTAAGQQAIANASATGSATITTTAATSGSGLIGEVSAIVGTSGGVGTLIGASQANIAGTTNGFSGTNDSAYASVTGLPAAGFVSSRLASHPIVAAKLGTGTATVLGYGVQGAIARAGTTGVQTYTSSIDWTINTSSLTGYLIFGALDNDASITSGFTSLTFTATVAGVTVTNTAFGNVAAADAFFNNNAVSLGGFAQVAGLTVDLTLALTTSSTGAGYGEDFFLGTTGGNGPPMIAAPGSLSLGIGQPAAIAGVSISETGSTVGETFTATVSDANGDLSATGATGNGSNSITLSGLSLAALNSDLATLTDTDGAAGTDTIIVGATDSLGGTATPAVITVAAQAPPGIAAPGSFIVGVGQPGVIQGISISEAGSNPSQIFSVTLSDTNGDLSATGASGNGTNSISLSGLSLSAVNSDLAAILLVEPTAAPDTIAINVSDSLGNVAAPQSIAVTVNGPPVISAPAAVTVAQGTVPIAGLSVSESGITDGETFTATISDTNGFLSAADAIGNGTHSITLSPPSAFSFGALNDDLATLVDVNLSPSPDTIVINASDSYGNVAATRDIAVTVNNPPAVAAPTSLTVGVNQSTPVVGVSLSEAGDIAGVTFSVALSDTNGDLSAAGAVRNGTNSISLSGLSLAALNSDLATLTDTDGIAGSDTITVKAADSVGGVAAPAIITVTANGPPVITAPADVILPEGLAPITGIRVLETGNTADERFTVALSAVNGFLSAAGAAGNFTHSIVLSVPSLFMLDNDLATLTDLNTTTAPDTITISADDSYGNGATQITSVTVNGIPAIAAPGSLILGLNQPAAIAGVSLSEAGRTSGETFTVTLSDTNGDLSATGAIGNGSNSITLSGLSLAVLNSDLATLIDTGVAVGSDTITINGTDSLGGITTPATTAIMVNGPPTISAPAAIAATQGAVKLTGVALSESGNTAGETFTATISDAIGLLSAGGASGNGTTTIALSGLSLSDLNSDLATLTAVEPNAATDTVTIGAGDSLGNTAVSQTIAVTVNEPPVIGAPSALALGQGVQTVLPGLSLSESGHTAGESFAVTVSDTNGVLFALDAPLYPTNIFGSGSPLLTLTGFSLAVLNSELATLMVLEPLASPDTITINASDSFGGIGAQKDIAVAVNGPPLVAVPASATVAETPTAIPGISISESGDTSDETFDVQLAGWFLGSLLPFSPPAPSGELAASGPGVSSSGSAFLDIRGSLAQVNADLATLTFADSAGNNDVIYVDVTDSLGGAASRASIAVSVIPLTISAPVSLTLRADQLTAIPGVSIAEAGLTISDLIDNYTVTLTDTSGVLAATGVASTGSGTSLTISGLLGQVNADLATLTDTETSGGSDTITIAASNDRLGIVAVPQQVGVTILAPALSGAGNTVGWALFGPPSIVDPGLVVSDPSSGTISSAIIKIGGGFLPGDWLNFTNHNGITGSYDPTVGILSLGGTASITDYQAALDSITYSSTSLTPTDSGLDLARSIDWQVSDGISFSNIVSSVVQVAGVSGSTFILTTGSDRVVGTPLNDLVIAGSNALSLGDNINGNGGTNTIAFSGGGTFNLGLPAGIANIQTIRAFEGQGVAAQTVTLRPGTSFAVDVASDRNGDQAPIITIIGATNTDTINLGAGNDVVKLAAGEKVNGGGGNNAITVTAASETVHGGSGDNVIAVTSATALGATIDGGTGQNTLELEGGGTELMGSNITGVSLVELLTTTKFTANSGASLQIAGNFVGGDRITVGANSQSVITGGPGEHVLASAANANVTVSGLGLGSELEITSGGTATLNSGTGGSAGDPLLVKLDAATNLTLSPMQYIDAIGSTGNDTITAGASGQTLTGGQGTDTLVGYGGGSDIFLDTASGLKGDTLVKFVSTDRIDITNLASATATLTATVSGGRTAVTVISGATRTSFLMTGAFAQSRFSLGSDGAKGTLINYH